MRRHLRTVAITILVGPLLAGCIPGGGSSSAHAVLTATPWPAFFDLPDEGTGSDTVTFTIRNVGPASTGPLEFEFVAFPEPGDSLPATDGEATCGDEIPELRFMEICTVTITLSGSDLAGLRTQLSVAGSESGHIRVPGYIV